MNALWSDVLSGVVTGAVCAVLWGVSGSVLARVVGRNNVVDTIWGSGFVLVGAACFVVARGIDSGDLLRQVLLMATVLVWGARLSWYVGVRSAGKETTNSARLCGRGRALRRPLGCSSKPSATGR